MRTFEYSKLQSQQWDSEILGLVAQIHEFKGRQELYLKQNGFEKFLLPDTCPSCTTVREFCRMFPR